MRWYKISREHYTEDLYSKLEKMHRLEYKLSFLDYSYRQKGWLPDAAYIEYHRIKLELNKVCDDIVYKMIPVFEEWVNRHFDIDSWFCEMGPGLINAEGDLEVISWGNSGVFIKENVKEALVKEFIKDPDFKVLIEEQNFRSNYYRILKSEKSVDLIELYFKKYPEAKEEYEIEKNIGISLGDFFYDHSSFFEDLVEFARDFYGDLNPTDEDLENVDFDIEEFDGNWWSNYIGKNIECEDGEVYGDVGPYFYIFEKIAKEQGYNKWKANFPGIEENEKNVKKSMERLENTIGSEDYREKTIAISLALNTAHYYGNMSKHLGLSKQEMNQLSNLDISEETEQLKRYKMDLAKSIKFYKIAKSNLFNEIKILIPYIIKEAQKVYEEWDQDKEGIDEVFGYGGICSAISEEISNVIMENIGDVNVIEGGQEGDDHSWIIVYRENEAFGVDIPHYLYEIGAGYSWRKKIGVVFKETDVEIFPIDIEGLDLGENEERYSGKDIDIISNYKTSAKTEKGKQEVSIWYHGTSRNFLSKILSGGLDPFPQKRTWSEDPDASISSPSRKSIGGTYVTQNLLTSMSSGRTATEKTLKTKNTEKLNNSGVCIVVMMLQPKSLITDEDDLSAISNSVFLSSAMNYHEYSLAQLYFSMINNDEFFEESKEKYASNFINSIEYELKGINKNLVDRLIDLLKNGFNIVVSRKVSHILKPNEWEDYLKYKEILRQEEIYYKEQNIDMDYYEFKKKYPEYSDTYSKFYRARDWEEWAIRYKFDLGEIPTPPNISESETNFQIYMDQLTKTLKDLARPSVRKTFSQTARILDPVGFTGNNKIVAILEYFPVRKENRVNLVWEADDPEIKGKWRKDFIDKYNKSIGYLEYLPSSWKESFEKEGSYKNWYKMAFYTIDNAEEEFPQLSGVVDGLVIKNHIPNIDSISAYSNNYTILNGIRSIPMKDWDSNSFVNKSDIERSKILANKIKESGEINPLIVAIDKTGDPWILEGIHRLAALSLLKKTAFPAIVVFFEDVDEINAKKFNNNLVKIAQESSGKSLLIGNVGADQEMTSEDICRFKNVKEWLYENNPEFLKDIESEDGDNINLNYGRDFLKEDNSYDIVVLHYIFNPDNEDSYKKYVGFSGTFNLSDLGDVKSWRSRLSKTNAKYIFIFGGDTEISGNLLKDIPGYICVDKGETREGWSPTVYKREDYLIQASIDSIKKLDKKNIWYKFAQENESCYIGKIKSSLYGLAAEALKNSTFEEFEKDFLREIKHGTYWHITKNPNFQIDIELGPRDLSSMAHAEMSKGALMITSNLKYWIQYFKSRKYAAQIDMSNVDKKDYYQVNRGFDNEFFVINPSKAKVIKTVPIKQALKIDKYRHQLLPQSSQELKNFYNKIWELNLKESNNINKENTNEENTNEENIKENNEQINIQENEIKNSKIEIKYKMAQYKNTSFEIPEIYKKTINIISDKAEQVGLKAYAVGGFVRDLLLGRKAKDLDIMVDVENSELYHKNIKPFYEEAINNPIQFIQAQMTGAKTITDVNKFIIKQSDHRPEFFRISCEIDYIDKSSKKQKQIKGELFETSINPSQLMAKQFEKTIPRGEAFGIFAIVTEIGEIEISYPRTETYTLGSRKPRTEMGTLVEDSMRRDASFNSLYLDLSNFTVSDPSGNGLNDLKNKVIRIPGWRDERIAKSDKEKNEINKRNYENILGMLNDDPLRILRYLRFKSQLSGHICNECNNIFN